MSNGNKNIVYFNWVLDTQEGFHQEWVAAFDCFLKDAAEASAAKWIDDYSSKASNCHCLTPIVLSARCLASHFKVAIVQHHWQTRFYQQLSPVIALVAMARMLFYTRHARQVLGRRVLAEQQTAWLRGAHEANWFLMCNHANFGIRIALDWAKSHTKSASGPARPELDMEGNLAPGNYDFENEEFNRDCGDWLMYLMSAALLPNETLHAIQVPRQKGWQRTFKLFQVSKWLGYFAGFPDSEDVQTAHDNMEPLLIQIKHVANICAATRATCKYMAACLASSWATLRCWYITPDTPGCHSKREGEGYSDAKAWSILQQQLNAMAKGQQHFALTTRCIE